MKKLLNNKQGQVIVDYVLTLLVVVSVVAVMATSFRKTLFNLWQGLSRDVAAPCPGCSTNSQIRFR